MNRRDTPDIPAPTGKLLFEDDGGTLQPAEAPATFGQPVQKSKRRSNGKFQQDSEQPRPSGRLRHEGEIPLPGAATLGAGRARQKPKPDAATAAPDTKDNPAPDGTNPGEAPPTPGAANAAPDGGASPSAGGDSKADKKAAREGKKLSKSKLRMENAEAKLDAAREKRAKQKPPKKPGILQNAGRAVKAEAWAVIHGKIYRAEDENVGVKAAHRTELAGESVVHGTSRFIRRRIRTRPARQVRKWETREIKARADYNFREMAREHPELNSNAFSRYRQKRKLRRRYQKEARKNAAKAGGTLARRAAGAAANAGRAVVAAVARHPMAALIIAVVFLIIVTLQSCVGGGMTVGQGILSALGGVTYMAEDGAINEADLMYSIWETDLLYEAQNAEETRPGYDEYIFSIDPVGHDPVALISFLTAKFDDFTFAEVEPVLRDIFDAQYELTFNEVVEVRYRTETRINPDTGEDYEVEVPYNWYILEVTLTTRPFAEVLAEMLAAGDEQDRYDIYNETGGNRVYVGSPFPFDWRGYVSCLFGWRVHPVTGEKDFHRAIDIAVPAGTDILAGGDGVAIEATTHSLYGLTVRIDYGEGGDPAGNITARYSHCSALLVSAGQTVKAGDVIARVGSTGQVTGPHLDLEILKDGELMNPIYYLGSPR